MCTVESLKRLKKWLFRERQPTWPVIAVDASGFSVGQRRVEWADVHAIAAFKRDLITFDDVWFRVEDAGGPLLICEEQPGFASWEVALIEHFPSVAGWREHVTQPAFAENFIVFYRRT